jgi:hypothetical protein
MISGGNLSFARVANVRFEGCVVGARVGRCAWEAVYSASAPSSKPSPVTSTLWRLALASWRGLGSSLDGSDERIPEVVEEDDHEF